MNRLALALYAALSFSTISASELIDHGTYEQLLEAQKVASDLRAQGRLISIFREPVLRKGVAVQLPFYQLRSAAEWSAARLQRQGFQAWVIPREESLGFVIQVAIVDTLEAANTLSTQLDEMGYKNIRTRNITWRSYQYLVQETGKRTEGAEVEQESIVSTESSTESNRTEVDSFSFGATEDVMTFGAQTNYDALLVQQDKDPSLRNQGFKIDDLRIELGGLDRTEGGIVDSSHYALLDMGYALQGAQWDAQLGVRLDAVRQGPENAIREASVDYGETFFRYRAGTHKFTVGAQKMYWGALDELAPGNVLAAQDLTRYSLDDLSKRYRAQPLLRYEGWFDRLKLDVVALPLFRPAELPELQSIWSPIDQVRGRALGLPADPALSALIQNASFATELERDHGGGGVRVSNQGRGFDWGMSVQHVRHSIPYFELNPEVRLALLSGMSPALAPSVSTAPSFLALHPFTDVASFDFSTVWGESTWRAEVAYLSDTPLTTIDFRTVYAPSVQLGLGLEFYPGDGNNRVSLQTGYSQWQPDEPVLQPEELAYFSGEVEMMFARESWRFKTRFYGTWSEEKIDYYVNPEIAYIRAEPSELYLGLHWFDGDEATAGEYHLEHRMIVFGWRTRY